MAILNRDDFFKKIHERMPSVTSDEDIGFLEDMTDTYNDLERKAVSGSEDWERKYHELDNSWREKYKHRFFNGGDRSVPPTWSQKEEDDDSSANIRIEDLFT